MNLHLPTWATVLLSAAAGVLEGLNVTVFGFPPAWQDLTAIGLAVLATIGISPLTGPALQTALHISHKTALALATLISTLTVAIGTFSIAQPLKGVLIGALALVAGVLFGTPSPVVPAPAPVAKKKAA